MTTASRQREPERNTTSAVFIFVQRTLWEHLSTQFRRLNYSPQGKPEPYLAQSILKIQPDYHALSSFQKGTSLMRALKS